MSNWGDVARRRRWPDMCRGSLSWGALVRFQAPLQRLGLLWQRGRRAEVCGLPTWTEAPTTVFLYSQLGCRYDQWADGSKDSTTVLGRDEKL